MVVNCVVDTCENTDGISTISLFRFPKDDTRCQEWKTQLGFVGEHRYANSSTKKCANLRICSIHFENNCFSSIGKCRLKKDAVPTLNLSEKIAPAQMPLTSKEIPSTSKEVTDIADCAVSVKIEDTAEYDDDEEKIVQALMPLTSTETIPSTLEEVIYIAGCPVLGEIEDTHSDDEVKYPLMQRCVTCWASGNDFLDIKQPCYLMISLKEAIIRLVPDMIATIKDDDKVCKQCQVSLEVSIKFIQQCLFVQEQLKSGKYKKTVEDDDINDDISQEDNAVSVDVEKAPIISLDHDYFVQNKVIQQLDKTDTVISVQQSNAERLKTFMNVFSKSNITVFDQSDGAKSKRMILLGSYHYKCNKNMPARRTETVTTKLPRSKCKYKCRLCSERFTKFVVYKQHLRGKHPFYCMYCNKQFPNKSSNIAHKREVHVKKKEESYVCDICGKYFTLADKFFTHRRVHKKPELTCEKCGRSYNQKIALDRHLLTHGEKSFECDRCFKKYAYSIALKHHIRRVHEPEELNIRIQCDECGKLLKTKRILANHKILVHSNKGPHECPVCQKKYTAEFYLQRHIKAVHVGGKHSYKKAPNPNKVRRSFTKRRRAIPPNELLPCKICGKYYKGFDKLKQHLERHIPTKRYACNYCGITLKNICTLKKHHQSHLSAKSLHRCNVCWKTLSSEEELKDHMAIHDKPRHQCAECGEFFHRKFLLHDHVLLKHTNPEDLKMSLKKVINETIESINENKITANTDVMDEKCIEGLD